MRRADGCVLLAEGSEGGDPSTPSGPPRPEQEETVKPANEYSLETVAILEELGGQQGRSYTKFLWHAEKLMSRRNPSFIIGRYEARIGAIDSASVLRSMVHVAAWVALIPRNSKVLPEVVDLLSKYLHVFGSSSKTMSRGSLPPRLELGLQLVQARVSHGLLHRGTTDTVDWESLRQLLLPRLNTFRPRSQQALETESKLPNHPDDSLLICGRKAARLLERDTAKWSHAQSDDRHLYIATLEERLKDALASGGLALRAVFRGAVAALSAPRALPRTGTLFREMDNAAKERLRMGLQNRVRSLILQVLDSGRLGLSDSRVVPAALRLHALLDSYREARTGAAGAAAGEQWTQLAKYIREPTSVGCTAADPPQPFRLNRAIMNSADIEELDPGVEIKCVECGFLAISKWFVHRRGVQYLIIPARGHRKCHMKPGAPMFPLVEQKTFRDHVNNWQLCEHGSRERDCRTCGQAAFCEHGRRRRECKACKSKGLVAKRSREQ